MARAKATPALAPSAWTSRQPISCQASVARAQPAEPMTNTSTPSATGPRRP